jgi:micrococcal nuclease
MYTYNATVTNVYDGDTITVDIDLGFGIWMKGQKIRLYGINTPEVRGEEREEGLKVRDFVRGEILDQRIKLETIRDSKGKYGRWLGIIRYIDEKENKEVILNDRLCRKGMAERKVY